MHVSGYKIFFWILFFQVLKVHGGTPEPAFKHFTTEDGLPSSQIYHSIQDAEGYMWFATDKGVVRYNGYEFKTFTAKEGLTDIVVFYLFEDYKKRIWMISFAGNIFIYENKRIQPYKYNSSIRPYIKRSFQLEISVDSLDHVYVASSFGEFVIDQKGTVTKKYDYDDRKGIIKLLIDDTQNFYKPVGIGFVTESWKNHILYYKHRSGTDSIPLKGVFNGRMRTIRRKNNALIFAMGNVIYQLKNRQVFQLSTVDNGIINLFEDSKGNLWISTMKGLVLYTDANNYFEKSTYLNGSYISSISEDREYGYWITTIDNGIYYLNNKDVKNYTLDSEINSPVTLASDTDHVYAGYFNGSIARMNTRELSMMIKEISGSFISSMYFDTSNSIFYVGNNRLRYYKNGIMHAFKDTTNKTSNAGFVRIKNRIFSAAFGNLIAILNDSIYSLGNFKTRILCVSTNDQNDLILGCIDGVYSYDESKKNIALYNPHLKDIRVDDIKLLNGNLYFATQGRGLLILKKDGTLLTIDESDGLCSNILHTLCFSGNTIWCGSNNGISKIDFSDTRNGKFSITAINVTNGLISNEINDLEYLNDTIWVASKKAVSFFSTSTNFVNVAHPQVHFISFKINNVDTLVNNNYVFPHTLNTIRIGFESPLFKSDGKQSYHYLLTNEEDSIEGVTTNREMDFLSLRPGQYSLYVTARNNSGIMSASPEKLNFVILSPWWQRTWFRICGLLALILSGTILYKRRVNLIEQKYSMEKKQASLQLTAMRAQMNPHFIFNVMDSIRNYIMEKDIDSAGKYLTSFAKLVRYTLEQSDKQECTLEEELNMLRIYIELEKERFSKLIEVTIHVNENVETSEIMVPTMILQPFIENAFKHGLRNSSKDGFLKIEVSGANDLVTVIIEDNGVVKEKNLLSSTLKKENSQSYGISLVQERIESYNKAYDRNVKFQIIQLQNSGGEKCGTRIVLEF